MSRQHSGGVPSPCIDVCRMDRHSGLCADCLRTIDEIAGWAALDDDGKREVLARVAERRERIDAKEGLR